MAEKENPTPEQRPAQGQPEERGLMEASQILEHFGKGVAGLAAGAAVAKTVKGKAGGKGGPGGSKK